jgi:hypothetical protein
MFHYRKYIHPFSSLLLCTLGSLSLVFSSCEKHEKINLAASPEIKMETIPVTDTIRHIITSNTLLTATHPWYIDGWVYVTNEATLRLEPGAVLKVLPTSLNNHQQLSGGLVITRGARLHAAGTSSLPVQIIVDSTGRNGGSGVIILGKAPVGKKEKTTADPGPSLSGYLTYGGELPNDSSGLITHLHISYYPATGRSFRGGLLLLGTGSKTIVEHNTEQILPVKKTLLKTSGLH